LTMGKNAGTECKMPMKKFFATEGPTGARSIEIKHPKAAQDVKLVENQRNIQSSMMIPEPIIVFKDPQRMPTEEIERSMRLLDLDNSKNELTVGDLSVVKAEKNSPEQVRQRLRKIRDGFTIGDLSIATDVHESIEHEEQARGAKAQGLTVGDLCVRRTVQPRMSESQKLAAESIEAGRKQRQEVDRIRQFIFKDQLEQEERRQAAIIKVREMKASLQ
jgi:hypothetical protein